MATLAFCWPATSPRRVHFLCSDSQTNPDQVNRTFTYYSTNKVSSSVLEDTCCSNEVWQEVQTPLGSHVIASNESFSLPRNQVPEWESSYVDYKGLKKCIKAAATERRAENDVDLAPFSFALDRSIETVDVFFNKRLGEAQRRLKLLKDRYGDHFDWPSMNTASDNGSAGSDGYDSDNGARTPDGYGLDRDEMAELLGALLELRSSLRKVQWYGEVNRRGFIKILKKCDKKTGSNIQRVYLETKVTPRPFASAAHIISAMQTVNTWLSKVGGTENLTEGEGGRQLDLISSYPILRRVPSSTTAGISPDTVEKIDQYIGEDEATLLADTLAHIALADNVSQRLLFNLLQRAITSKALCCVELLLGLIGSLNEPDDINERNIIHRLIIAIGRSSKMNDLPTTAGSHFPFAPALFITPAENPIQLPPIANNVVECDGTVRLSEQDESVRLLVFILEKLSPAQRSALEARDVHGRMALHYAAQYGFVVICRLIIKHMREWGQFDVLDGVDSARWQDSDGYAPLHLAVIGQHPKTTKTLLEAECSNGSVATSDKVASARKMVSKSSAVLIMAVKANSIKIVKLLVGAGVDINYQDESGETALHSAARLGHLECAKILLSGNESQKADIEVAEKTYGWTPLFVAAVEGKTMVAELLMDSCDIDKVDMSGWYAMEHAALRGHLEIAKKLAARSKIDHSSINLTTPSTAPQQEINPSTGLQNIPLTPSGSSTTTKTPAVKSFGHRYLKKGEAMVLVTLGSMDTRYNTEAVKLYNIPVTEAHSTQLDTALSLVISAQNATGEPSILDLPVDSSISTEDPIAFETSDVSKVRLMFDLVPTYAGSHDRIIGRAVALLNTIKTGMGKNRASLQGRVQVPILAVTSLEIIGLVNFEFSIVTPFEHPNIGITTENTYWKSLTSPKVIGHRGLGKNFPGRKSLQLGENTLLSFIHAAKLGASYIEFDVQLTKDHVPVIYHDFVVGESGIDAPVHTMTLEQFMLLKQEPSHDSQTRSPDIIWANSKSAGLSIEEEGLGQRTTPFGSSIRRARSKSLNQSDGQQIDMESRMKHARAFKKHGFKGNSRGTSIQGPFTTLEGIFKALEPHVGFNIELKYPMLQESENEEMDVFVIEMNAWVDAVLKVVYDHGKGRDMIFSSFNPDICLMLSFKQPSIPILFLTEGGTASMADIRASSLQEAIRFSSRWNLLGIVSAVEPLVICPRLIKVIKESGLLCFTYGVLNNEPQNVRLQWRHGVDAVIVDKVLAIAKELRPGDDDPLESLQRLQKAKQAVESTLVPVSMKGK